MTMKENMTAAEFKALTFGEQIDGSKQYVLGYLRSEGKNSDDYRVIGLTKEIWEEAKTSGWRAVSERDARLDTIVEEYRHR